MLLLCLVSMLILSGCAKKGVDSEYAFNTSILSNVDSPTALLPEFSEIDGYTEIAVDGLSFPYAVPDTALEIISAGSYSGEYLEDENGEAVSDVFSLIVRNTGDDDISYSTFSVRYGEGEDAVVSFSPTNLASGLSCLVMAGSPDVKSSDVLSFEIVSSMQVSGGKLSLINGQAGVSFSEDHFILTNLTSQNLGDVYIRFKRISPRGNCYLGGMTFSVYQSDVSPYETYLIDAPSFDDTTCSVIAVESIPSS